MATLKNAILRPLQKLIGVAPATLPTVVDLENVSLTLPIIPEVVRRSSAHVIEHGGLWQGVLENVHSGADNEISSLRPYEPGENFVISPFPAVITDEWDLWLSKVGGRRSSGTGALSGAAMILTSIGASPMSQAWGKDDVAAKVEGTSPMVLAQFDGISTLVDALNANEDPMITEDGKTWVDVNMRIPRGALLAFKSTAAAAAEFQMWFILGLFPAGMGQDLW